MLKGLLPQMPPPLTLLGVVLVLFLLYLLCSTPGPGKDPPGPRPLPLLGNLLHLDLKRLHVSLCELSKKYGSVFTVHLGPKKVVVLAGYRTVKQALVNYAEEFGDREILPIFRDIYKEHGVIFANGNSWKEMRRFSLSTLRDFGMGKRGSEERIIEESRHLIKVFDNFKGEPFNTVQPVNYSVSNIICAIMYGSRFDYADATFQNMVNRANENVRILGSVEIQVYNAFPWLRWCCSWLLVNRTQTLKNAKSNIEEIIGLVLGLKDTLNPQDLRGFVDAFLVRQQEESDQPGSYFHNNNLKFTVGNLFAAGTDTTATTLRWGLLLMAKYPHIQDQVQEELNQVIGDREPRMEDRRNLPYTDAVIHEIQRVANIVPLSIPHTTSCDVTFRGYFIKKGTIVIPLLTSVLQDEEEWETPHSFNPGHFLDEKGCFIKRDAFMPFSAGRRSCLGESLARMELFLFFTFLLQRFRFTPPSGVSEDELDLTPTVRAVLSPSPHQLCAVSRA
ncbi:cytochrome P450 2K1-like isoform X1 [Conger conger]|uniref:cytochrome P450 2K1-like isoform X1 n=1 Tax=Conger conger TaxID=82655 RepID=UPI002A59AE7F|nr:cytochrome P450 2K1-like isoform X1 [Conger conger]XP_061086096.1 cytochrome P450 2K1-like isoform X1 [Conger conger]XP_061086097.1 cytochrome P450 2K1-like isoform X1 [Conger conger]